MYARKVIFKLKPFALLEFSAAFVDHIIPILKRQKGFQDEIVLVIPGANDVMAISFWDTMEDGENWSNSRYQEVMDILRDFLKAEPRGHTFAVIHHSRQNADPADPMVLAS
jgi:heme-degrading monooxygenase HmoA